jgi:hypothetical protein
VKRKFFGWAEVGREFFRMANGFVSAAPDGAISSFHADPALDALRAGLSSVAPSELYFDRT